FLQRQAGGVRKLIINKKYKDLYLRFRGSLSLRNPYKIKNMHGAQISWSWTSKGIDKITERYDVAIAYSQGTPTYFVAEKVVADKKFCWVNTDYKVAPYNKSFDTAYYEQFDNIVAVSELNKEVFIQEMPIAKEKTNVVYDIISPSLIKSMANQQGGFTDEYDGVRILTIGRLVDAKGYDMAIEACFKLKTQGFKHKWYVIGEGHLKEKLEMMIKKYKLEDTFILLGTFHNPYVYLKQCDIYVQPSRFEGFGLAIAEARILQKPVIATNFTVIHDQIKDGENGLIVNMNSEDLHMGISKILGNSSLREHIRENLGKESIGTEEEINKVYAMIES
ncbi:glycosyltransferase, partial [Paenibacillus sp. TAF58]